MPENAPAHFPDDRQEDFLLHSMRSFKGLLFPLFDLLQPRTICEIGLGKGLFHNSLRPYCRERDITLIGIDTTYTPPEPLAENEGFLQQPSLEGLLHIPPQDVYIIDGDHNYYTVRQEIDTIFRKGGDRLPLMAFHDVHWPWARRDLYYNAEAIPEEYRRPRCNWRGPVPGKAELQDIGLGARFDTVPYEVALEEGTPRNGVLTAIEDVMAEKHLISAGWRFIHQPLVFGLGLLYHPQSMPAPARQWLHETAEAFDRLRPLLETVEFQRMNAYIRHLESTVREKDLRAHTAEVEKHRNGLQKHSEELLETWKRLSDYADRLLRNYNKLRDYTRTVMEERDALKAQEETLRGDVEALREELVALRSEKKQQSAKPASTAKSESNGTSPKSGDKDTPQKSSGKVTTSA